MTTILHPAVTTRTKLSPDETCDLFVRKLAGKEPFYFIRYGDGAIECIGGKRAMGTADGEAYTSELGGRLYSAWNRFSRGGPSVMLGDWLSCSFDGDYQSAYVEDLNVMLRGIPADLMPTFVHFEALLLMRKSSALLNFYRTLKADQRRKLFMGPAQLAGAAKMLGAEHMTIPMTTDLFRHVPWMTKELLERQYDVLIFSAGMAGTLAVTDAWEKFPERTYIHLGSALDPVFWRKSRKQQMNQSDARIFLRELL